MEKKYFVILSDGAYSEYCPTHYMGEREITQEELTAKSLEIGNPMWEWYENLPERMGTDFMDRPQLQKYDPENPGRYIGWNPSTEEFIKKMEEWLTNEGFTKVPGNLPEINIYYDVPRSN